MYRSGKILILLLIFTSRSLYGQVTNDSSRTIYGPKTCKYTFFNNIKYNKPFFEHPDTVIQNFEKYDYVSRYDNKLQDLGNIGSSAKPVFYEAPDEIGRTSGYYTYQWYNLPLEKIKLYNTRSPYTDVYTVLGGGYRTILDVTFSQNIKPSWNFGGNFQRLVINKQYSSTGRGDDEVMSTSFDGYMYYWTHDSTYFVLGAFTHMFHHANESGGIKDEGFQSLDDYFGQNINVNLEKANAAFLRNDYLVYQQYSLSPMLTLYNDLRYRVDHDYFSDPDLKTEGSFFGGMLFNTDTTSEFAKYSAFANESGIKGIFFHKAFYNAFFRYRSVDFNQKYLTAVAKSRETYLGGNLRYDLDTTHFLMFTGELMQNGNHLLGADYENKLWKLSYRRMMYSPTFLEENYFGNHYEWHNNFKPIQSDNATALLKVRVSTFRIMPEVNLSLVKNYVYYGLDKMPAQANGFAELLSPGIKFNFEFLKAFHWEGEGLYTLKTGNNEASDAFRIPSIFINSQIFFHQILFNSNLNFMAGIDGHYLSGYYADAYDPVVQQFYLQNNFKIPGHLLTNVFINLGIGNVKIFVQMTYINQKKGSGYFVTPYYTGLQKVFDFGISWMFYD